MLTATMMVVEIVAITARHYAKWISDVYRAPLQLEDVELPADLLSRLAESHQSRITSDTASKLSSQIPDFLGGPNGNRTRVEIP